MKVVIPRPSDDVGLGPIVEVAFGERRRVERVEDLPQLANPHLDRALAERLQSYGHRRHNSSICPHMRTRRTRKGRRIWCNGMAVLPNGLKGFLCVAYSRATLTLSIVKPEIGTFAKE